MKAFNPSTSQWEDVYVKALDSFPVGVIVEYPTTDSAKLPTGYMFCDGSAISRTEYSELFSLIGTSFGAGDGSTTFNIPSKEGVVTAGIKSSDTDFDTIGKTGGSKYLQKHIHMVTGGAGGTLGTNDNADRPASMRNSTSTRSVAGFATGQAQKAYGDTTSLQLGESGNLQPYEVSNFIIKVKPTRVLASTVVNAYNESTENAYSSDYCNKAFGGTVLWTNPNPTSNFTPQSITLSSDDYDVLELFYYSGTSNSNIGSAKTIKGKNFIILWWDSVNNRNYSRAFTYTNNTHYAVDNCTVYNVGNYNNVLIPYKIIGYKTGLFS